MITPGSSTKYVFIQVRFTGVNGQALGKRHSYSELGCQDA
jgi:hypothetical protein